MQTNTTQREPESKKTQRRRKGRTGAEFTGQRLGVNKSKLDFEKYVYRWVNDTQTGRISAMTKEDDWDPVMNDGVKDDNADLGNAVSQVVGVAPEGGPLRAYLCRKPRTFYDEDQRDKSAELDEQLERLKRGEDRAGGSQSDYTPNTGIRLG